jgi:hypothetical protein
VLHRRERSRDGVAGADLLGADLLTGRRRRLSAALLSLLWIVPSFPHPSLVPDAFTRSVTFQVANIRAIFSRSEGRALPNRALHHFVTGAGVGNAADDAKGNCRSLSSLSAPFSPLPPPPAHQETHPTMSVLRSARDFATPMPTSLDTAPPATRSRSSSSSSGSSSSDLISYASSPEADPAVPAKRTTRQAKDRRPPSTFVRPFLHRASHLGH